MRVLVLGGGYAGVSLARKLERRLDDDHELVLVDEDGTHLVQHELHRLVRRPSLAEEVVLPLADVLDRTRVVEDRVEAVDADARVVDLASGDRLTYDVGAVCLGAAASHHVEGAADHGIPLKRVEHAREIHDRAIEILAPGDGSTDVEPESTDAGASSDLDAHPRIVVAGAGLSGVQVAGELAELAESRGHEVGADVSVEVVEREASVAPGFEADFQEALHDTLTDRSIGVETDARIVRVAADAVYLDGGEMLSYDLLVWAGGITGSAALDGERPVVDARLQLGDRTFGLGDAVRVVDNDGQPVPATAQAAVREAETVAENVERVLEDADGVFEPRLERFTFDSPGWVVSVGDGAVASVGPAVLTGRAALAVKTTVGVGYLSSVGALREAVDLVNAELDLAVEGE